MITLEEKFKHSLWLLCQFAVNRYLIVNADGRWDGAEKALRHRELCLFFFATQRLQEKDEVYLRDPLYIAIHDTTQELTDNLDTEIGFPLKGRPDYDTLAPLFFKRFYALAMRAISEVNKA